MEDRAVEALGQVGGVVGGTAGVRGGGEADLVVHNHMHRAADGVARQARQVQGLLDHAQACEGCVTVEHDRHDREVLTAFLSLEQVGLGACHTHQHRVHSLKVGGVGGQGDLDLTVAEHLDVLALKAQVVLHVAGATLLSGLEVALKLVEDRCNWLANNVEQHVQTATVRHTNDNLVQALAGGGVNSSVHKRDQGFCAFKGEALLAQVLGLQEVLKGLSGVELLQDVLLLRVGRLRHASLHAVTQPLTLITVHHVCVLSANVQGVGGAQTREHLAQRHALLAAETTHVEGAVQIPQGQAVGLQQQVAGIRLRQARLVPAQRVGVRDQVATRAVCLDELHDAGVLVNAGIRQVLCPAQRGVGDFEGFEDFVPKLIVDKQLRNVTQELTGLCTLDDTVVIGGGQGDQLAHAKLSQAVLGGACELCRVIHRTNANDGALALGQTRDGVAGTNAARVGQLDGHTGEVIHGQLAHAGAVHDVFVCIDELVEGERLTLLNGGNHQVAGTVLTRQVNSQPQVDVLRLYREGLLLFLAVVLVHVRVQLGCLDDGVTNDVGKGDLAAAGALQVIIDQGAVLKHELDRHVTHGGSRGNLKRLVHVLGNSAECALELGLTRLNLDLRDAV